MNKGVEILLERIKSNPDEFIEEGALTRKSKWGSLIADYQHVLDAEDQEALKKALNQMMQDKFTEKVMKELLDPKSEVSGITASPYQSATGLGGAIQGLSTIQNKALNNLTLGTNGTGQLAWQPNTTTLTLGNQTLDQETLEHMKAHLKYLKDQEQLKKPKTLFGRLFNYQ